MMESFLFDISFWNSFLANFFAGLLLAVLFFFLKEKLFKIPDLNGVIYLRQVTEKTGFNPYKSMELQYILSLRMENNKIYGSAEKIYEDSSVGTGKEHIIHYEGKNRTICKIEGVIQKRYFSWYDIFIFHSYEENENRKSTTYYSIKIERKRKMYGNLVFKQGFFKSTIANQEGIVELSENEFKKKTQKLPIKVIVPDR